MDLINSVAAGAGEAIANRLLDCKRKRDNIFTRLFGLIKLLISDPEKMELNARCEGGKLIVKVKPDRDEKKGFIVKLSTFEES